VSHVQRKALIPAETFRELALVELREVRSEIVALATDRDIYWKVQHEVIHRNRRLLTVHSPYFDMLNDAYAHATAARVRRLVDKDKRTISLLRLLRQLVRYPDLFNETMSTEEVVQDADDLERATSKITDYVDQFVAHHDRTPVADAPIYRELDAVIDLLIAVFRKYYGVLAGADIDVVVSYLEEPLAIFRFAWIEAK